VTRALAAAVLAALALPAAASAHATLVSTSPADGAVLAHAPRAVVVRFDDAVRVGHRTAAVANDTGDSILAGPPTTRGRTLRIPLRAGLADGDYSVRWSIVSADGHAEVGVLAFAVGAGAPTPHSVLDASAPLSATTVTLRTLWYAGLLVAGGAAALGLLGGLDPARRRRPLAQLLFAGLLVAFVGASGLVHGAAAGTRFALALDAAAILALAGGMAAALAPVTPALLRVATGCSLASLLVPTFAGHALDRDQPVVLAPLIDVAHLAAAAVWLGGLAWLAYVVPRATHDDGERLAAARRFSATALLAVAVLAVSGVGRAVTELGTVDDLWTTSYGRTLLVKTAIFATVVAVGATNRRRLAAGVHRLRTTVRVELVALVGVAVAVAFLTQLRPGRDAPSAATAATPRAGGPPALPPLDAVVSAHELGTDAVAVGRTPQGVEVTVLDPNGNGADGLDVTVAGTPTTSCGSGCYAATPRAGRRLTVRVGDRQLVFDVPVAARDATALLARVAADYRAQKTVVYRERLASTPTNAQQTQFVLVAPDRLRYAIAGGPQAVVIGPRRWDRTTPTGRWVETPQSPLQVPHPLWYAATNARLVAPRTITFLDRAIPAWFTLHLDARGRLPRRLDMTAASHFMVDRYSSFGSPRSIEPPASR
jgi:copper transport protein